MAAASGSQEAFEFKMGGPSTFEFKFEVLVAAEVPSMANIIHPSFDVESRVLLLAPPYG